MLRSLHPAVELVGTVDAKSSQKHTNEAVVAYLSDHVDTAGKWNPRQSGVTPHTFAYPCALRTEVFTVGAHRDQEPGHAM